MEKLALLQTPKGVIRVPEYKVNRETHVLRRTISGRFVWTPFDVIQAPPASPRARGLFPQPDTFTGNPGNQKRRVSTGKEEYTGPDQNVPNLKNCLTLYPFVEDPKEKEELIRQIKAAIKSGQEIQPFLEEGNAGAQKYLSDIEFESQGRYSPRIAKRRLDDLMRYPATGGHVCLHELDEYPDYLSKLFSVPEEQRTFLTHLDADAKEGHTFLLENSRKFLPWNLLEGIPSETMVFAYDVTAIAIIKGYISLYEYQKNIASYLELITEQEKLSIHDRCLFICLIEAFVLGERCHLPEQFEKSKILRILQESLPVMLEANNHRFAHKLMVVFAHLIKNNLIEENLEFLKGHILTFLRKTYEDCGNVFNATDNYHIKALYALAHLIRRLEKNALSEEILHEVSRLVKNSQDFAVRINGFWVLGYALQFGWAQEVKEILNDTLLNSLLLLFEENQRRIPDKAKEEYREGIKYLIIGLQSSSIAESEERRKLLDRIGQVFGVDFENNSN